MTKFSTLLACGAIALAAGISQAHAQNRPTFYGPGDVSPLSFGDMTNPGASYGLNSTEAGIAGATIGDTMINGSSQGYDGPLLHGRAATSAPPMDESAVPPQ